jgi:hypothetical protein
MSSGQQALLSKGTSIFRVSFAGLTAEAFLSQLFHEPGNSGAAEAEAALAAAEATGS